MLANERPHHHGELGDVLRGLLVRLRVRTHPRRRDSTLWEGLAINRLAGIPCPLWGPPRLRGPARTG